MIRETTRGAITRLRPSYRPGPLADIALVSSPRSGSTWMMESLAALPGYKSIDEPDHKSMLEFHGALKIPPRWQWICLAEHEKADFGDFLRSDARSRIFGPVRPGELLAQRGASRRVLKLIRVTNLLEWIDDTGFATVYLIRHPIPQALSCMARGHPASIREFLTAGCLVSQMSPEQLALLRSAADRPDRVDSYVTQWCLENFLALRSPRLGNSITVSSYEGRVLEPNSETRRVGGALNVTDVRPALAHATTPSRVTNTSSASTRRDIRTGNRRNLLAGWRRKVTAADEARLMEVVEQFDIDIYRRGSDLPFLPLAWKAGSTSEPGDVRKAVRSAADEPA